MNTPSKGSHHFLVQRVTALALIPLVIWLCINIALLPEASYEVITAWLRSPFNGIMMTLLIVISFHHAHLGMQVIYEDYISDMKSRKIAISITKYLSYFMMAAGLYAMIRITLGGQ